MYTESEFVTPPSDDAVLWRYMDFTKFVSLLEKSSLFFARADKLKDPFEGTFSRMNKILRPILYADVPENIIVELKLFQREVRRFTLISCWHESPHESEAMWRLYSRETDGIAIKTDFSSFKKSLTDSQRICVGKVNYVDYEDHFIPENNSLSSYLHKRQSFEHEREVRAIARITPIKDGKMDLSQDICDIGKYFQVDLSLLIQEVVVAPYAPDWLLELIKSVATRYDLMASVKKSPLADNPTWD